MSVPSSHLFAFAVFTGGVLLGPAYCIYCGFFTGAHAISRRWETGAPLTLRLSPEMNPIRFQARAQRIEDRPTNVYSNPTYFRAVLTKDEETIWEAAFAVIRGLPPGPPDYTPVQTFSVERAGTYSLRVRPDARSTVRSATLELRVTRNYREPNIVVGILGFAMFLVGGGWLMLAMAIRSDDKTRRARAKSRSSRSQRPGPPVGLDHD